MVLNSAKLHLVRPLTEAQTSIEIRYPAFDVRITRSWTDAVFTHQYSDRGVLEQFEFSLHRIARMLYAVATETWPELDNEVLSEQLHFWEGLADFEWIVRRGRKADLQVIVRSTWPGFTHITGEASREEVAQFATNLRLITFE